MPLFRCSECGCAENTACCNYWVDVHCLDRAPRCSACDPDIGAWHGRFLRRRADGMQVDSDGFLFPAGAGSAGDGLELPGVA